MRRSHHLLLFPPVARPDHLPSSDDAKVLWLCWPAGRAMARYVPPAWSPPFAPAMARRHLLLWWQEVADIIAESTRGHYSMMQLSKAPGTIQGEMQDWLDGIWSTRRGLIEALWRLEIGERNISAALWLHRIADDGTGRHRKGMKP